MAESSPAISGLVDDERNKVCTNTNISDSPCSSCSSRRHSCGSSYLRDYASAEFQKSPIKVLARSITQGALEPRLLPNDRSPSLRQKAQKKLPLIDLKFIDLYVKKGRQNSEPAGGKRTPPVLAKRLSCGNATSTSSSESVNGKISDRLPLLRGQASTNRGLGASNKKQDNIRCVSSRSPNIGEKSSDSISCYRILESLYVGGANAASNDALLKELKIDHLIHLRNASTRQAIAPIPINNDKKILSLLVDQSIGDAGLENCFQQIDIFITKARTQGKIVLLYDNDGRNEAPAAVVQYLMHYYKMKYQEAKVFVSQIVPEMRMPTNFETILCREDNSDKLTTAASSSLHQANGSSHCRNGLKYTEHKKHLAWA